MTATITRPKPKKAAAASKKESSYKRLHVIIPIEDMLWASQQKPSVTQLWQECWTADPYGSRWMPLTSALGYSTFMCAKKILSDSGLFIFKPDKSIQDSRETVTWMVKNLHGSRIKEFWEKANSASPKPDAEKQELNAEISEIDAGSEEIGALYKASISGENQPEQGFQKLSRTVQEHLTNSTKEFVRCNSDTLTEISHCEEAAITPLGVASPQSVESVSEKEKDLPVAMDCTTLALVDDAQSNPALLLAENQNRGVEPRDCHEGTGSAAPVAQNEKSLNYAMPAAGVAIANQTQGQVEQGYSATLLAENSVSGLEVKAVDKGETSAAPVTEKWSHKAIVARSNVRPVRREKLNRAANSGKNPGFDFLQECWNDDPALQIVIKKLLAKFPQWRVAVIDGKLIECNE
ncbi:Methyl-accepting chemotaxis protein (plasmid) [Nostoc flagelliforme CCNUN1]|uniref:Methyl-accepting chemotaxis protein n=1 Tax=Nostoc flagelliforme CCNUN1 TaxID=2038116 RepID=A0A2K8T6M2_9NOSO|nr:hypothetical protein [Nostoc flagelliforme]AUB43321.1 Methyl-accepting chemotaxis protein [Nostoc flagelliforme CCNUN1]